MYIFCFGWNIHLAGWVGTVGGRCDLERTHRREFLPENMNGGAPLFQLSLLRVLIQREAGQNRSYHAGTEVNPLECQKKGGYCGWSWNIWGICTITRISFLCNYIHCMQCGFLAYPGESSVRAVVGSCWYLSRAITTLGSHPHLSNYHLPSHFQPPVNPALVTSHMLTWLPPSKPEQTNKQGHRSAPTGPRPCVSLITHLMGFLPGLPPTST